MTLITASTVKALKPGEQIADAKVDGFRARCLGSGRVRFTLRYRNGGGQRREVPLGMWGSLTADQARELAQQRYMEAKGGKDPLAERQAASVAAGNTVDRLLDERIDWMRRQGKRSTDEVARAFDRHIRPFLGKKQLTELTLEDMRHRLDRIAKDAPQMARCVHANFNAAWTWGRGKFPGLDRLIMPKKASIAAETKRSRVLDDDELRTVWLALDRLEDGSPYRDLIRTVIMTGCRINEVAGMHASEFKGDDWIIPAARYKTSFKNGKDHVVPMISEIAAVLPKKTVGFIFASAGFDRPFSGFSKAKALLDAEITKLRNGKPMAHWTVHDLRRTARTRMAKLGIPTEVAERVIGHVINGIESVYNQHDYRAEKVEALTAWARYVDGVVHGSPAKIVSLPRGSRQLATARARIGR